MKTLAILISLLAISGLYLFVNDQQPLETRFDESVIMKEYVMWKSEHGQNYNGSEDEYRYSEFRNNWIFIQNHNMNSDNLKLKATQFAAMSNEEYRLNVLLRNKVSRRENAQFYKATGMALPSSVDWVSKGAVYATQNQGQCGSCWAFATIGGLQGLRYIVDGVLELLSAQQVTSCVAKEYLDDKTQGCGGGEARYAYNYTSINGIETWESYPYVNAKGGVAAPCQYNKKKVVFYNEGVGFVNHDDVQGMKENLVNQPLTIAVDAASIYFQLYSTGTITSNNCGTQLNHAILLVGYNENANPPYWTVQNSWGTGWGNKGFGQIAITEGDGVCGINMQVDYPTSINQKK